MHALYARQRVYYLRQRHAVIVVSSCPRFGFIILITCSWLPYVFRDIRAMESKTFIEIRQQCHSCPKSGKLAWFSRLHVAEYDPVHSQKWPGLLG